MNFRISGFNLDTLCTVTIILIVLWGVLAIAVKIMEFIKSRRDCDKGSDWHRGFAQGKVNAAAQMLRLGNKDAAKSILDSLETADVRNGSCSDLEELFAAGLSPIRPEEGY